MLRRFVACCLRASLFIVPSELKGVRIGETISIDDIVGSSIKALVPVTSNWRKSILPMSS
ncbi:hypothetical protein [Metallosphaera hakonensis]|uniref:hypothetical protein n=1 Tax=Metallosphaera hakonensis TaxID=79601 RepID=UPI0020928316|nr:hypothetical protein [Metallosphaera hakonensis]